MTEPDPHAFVLSRRALRDRAGRAHADGAPVLSRSTRRSHRASSGAPALEVVPLTFSTRRALRELSALPHRPIDSIASAGTATFPAGQLRTTTRRRRTLELVREPLETPAAVDRHLEQYSPTHLPAPLAEPTTALSGASAQHRVETESVTSTPVWDAVIGRPAPKPLTELASPAAAAPAAVVPPAQPERAIFRPPPPPLKPPPLEPLIDAQVAASTPVRHGRRRSAPIRIAIAAVAAAALVLGTSAAVTAAVTGPPAAAVAQRIADVPTSADLATGDIAAPAPPPVVASLITAAEPAVTAEPAPVAICETPAVVAALQAGDDAAAIATVGGPAVFRAAVASGAAPCVNLADAARLWLVVDKSRPLNPIDFEPATLASPDGVRILEGGGLRTDAAAAMSALVAAAAQAGAGEIGLQSAYRSYDTQIVSYGSQVSARGVAAADLVSARPGFSEHQSGLAADVVPCADGCGSLDDLGSSAQGQWIAEHAWEYGWIVRYEDGYTGVTGYSPEPWHLRYLGVELAKEYHDGGWHTLEEFFGLPAAPEYAG